MSTEPNQVDKDFEEGLRKAMQRVDAPPTMLRFLEAAAQVQADRLLPRKERRHKWAFSWPRPQMAAWMTGAMAAVLAVGVFTAGRAYQQHERRVEATRQFETATQITERALAQTRQQLQQAGVPLE